MKVLFIIDDLRSGGAQRQMVELAKGFRQIGYQVSILFYFPHFYYAEELRSNQIEYKCIPVHNPIKRIFLFRKTIRNLNPEAIIAFLGVPSLISEIASIPWKNWKLIVGERSANPKIYKSVKSRLIRGFHFIADYIVANSHENINMVKIVNPLIPGHKLKVIYNSIDLNEYNYNPDYIYKKNDVLRILVLASYRSLKNLVGLVEAVNSLGKEKKNKIIIDWFGDRSNNPEGVIEKCEYLINKYHLQETIRLHDTNCMVSQLIQDYDAIGLFSFFEGLPNSICEGMACGKVIICSRISDLPMLVSENLNGFLFNPHDIVSINEALSLAINSTDKILKQMGVNNRKKAEQLFNDKMILNQYLELLG